MHVFVKRQKTLCVSIYLDIQKSALLSNSLNQIKKDVIWLCVPQRMMTVWRAPLLQLNKCSGTNEISAVAISTLAEAHFILLKHQPQLWWLVCNISCYCKVCHFLLFHDGIWNQLSSVFFSSKRRKLAASTDLGHLHTHGENIWNCKGLNDQLSPHVCRS